ncbi:MAG: urea ABC transporter permease subunit UrtB, partial [Alphaproteobacteria bacterium]
MPSPRRHSRPVATALWFAAVLALLIAAWPPAARAQAASDTAARDAALLLLADKSATKRMEGVAALAATGDPAAAEILAAMSDGDLYYRIDDNRIVIAKGSGGTLRVYDPIAGADLGEAPSSSLEKVRVNNRLRRVIRGALGGLNLTHPDAGKRLAAAADLLRSPDEDLREPLVAAFEKEADEQVKSAMGLAL